MSRNTVMMHVWLFDYWTELILSVFSYDAAAMFSYENINFGEIRIQIYRH